MVGLISRLVLGGALLVAGLTKIGDLDQSVLAVRAYQLLPWDLAAWVGYGLPVFEIILGAVILVGLFTRWSALVGVLVMAVFIFGISWAWAKGLAIDCGCFGDGGTVNPGETQYPFDIARDLLFAAAGLWLVARPRSPWAVDSWLFASLPDDLPADDQTDDQTLTTKDTVR